MLDKKDLELIAGVVNAAVQPIGKKLDIVEEKVLALERDVSEIRVSLENVENRLENVENRLDKVENHLEIVENRLETMDNRLTIVELSLENETNRNIRFIAEGHQNLDRKLNEAIKLCQDSLSYTEQFQLRQTCFECEISILKERVSKLECRSNSTQEQTA